MYIPYIRSNPGLNITIYGYNASRYRIAIRNDIDT